MESCWRLYEYSYLISRIRFHLDQGLTLAAAADKAITDCFRGRSSGGIPNEA